MIQMEVLGLQVDPASGTTAILLREQTEPGRVLPIFIGALEARAIALGLEGVEPPRPLTHDLLLDVLGALGMSLDRIVVTELRDGTFYAELALVGDEGERTVSSRPSDAIALAVRRGTPMFAEDDVMLEAGMLLQEEDGDEDAPAIEEALEEFRDFLDDIDPEDFGTPEES